MIDFTYTPERYPKLLTKETFFSLMDDYKEKRNQYDKLRAQIDPNYVPKELGHALVDSLFDARDILNKLEEHDKLARILNRAYADADVPFPFEVTKDD